MPGMLVRNERAVIELDWHQNMHIKLENLTILDTNESFAS